MKELIKNGDVRQEPVPCCLRGERGGKTLTGWGHNL